VSALGASGLPASRLELEITEAVMLQDTETTLATLAQLKGLGVRISMDDFGTGYSSLSYLRKFPFDKIKIDQSFIRDLSTRPESMAIIRAIAGLGAALGIATTAEGVETEDQLRVVRAEGCTQVQGYLLGRPQPASTIPGLLLEFENKRSLAV
jgi:EAL domain-containing protein (putative c-di-GMP-specific phosphodiesterase class I)